MSSNKKQSISSESSESLYDTLNLTCQESRRKMTEIGELLSSPFLEFLKNTKTPYALIYPPTRGNGLELKLRWKTKISIDNLDGLLALFTKTLSGLCFKNGSCYDRFDWRYKILTKKSLVEVEFSPKVSISHDEMADEDYILRGVKNNKTCKVISRNESAVLIHFCF